MKILNTRYCLRIALTTFAVVLFSCQNPGPPDLVVNRIKRDLSISESDLIYLGGDKAAIREKKWIFEYRPQGERHLDIHKNPLSDTQKDEYRKWLNNASEWSGTSERIPEGAEIFEMRGASYTIFLVEYFGKAFIYYLSDV